MLRIVREIAAVVLALGLSFGLLVSIPMLQLFLKTFAHEKKYVKTEITLKKDVQVEQKQQQQKPTRQPKRANTMQRTVKAGPSFAMDLGVASSNAAAGAVVSSDLLKAPGGGG